jgi:choline dehydrogenase-like flavoprotein
MSVLRGREVGAPMRAQVDAVIIGSGASGAVIARELARDGRSVLTLEEGGYYTPEEYGVLAPSQSLRRLAREAGLAVAVGLGDTPLISTLAGRAVGGSSLLTGGIIFRIPEEILHGWSTTLGLHDLTPDALDPFFTEIEEAVHAELVPEAMRSRSTELFVEGATKLGIPMKSVRRNTSGCRGASRCTFGCPNRAKMSVDISFWPDAWKHGAEVWADALVERVDVASGRAVGVRGRFLDQETGEPRVPFEVSAKMVIVACGALHSPLLLLRSGLAGPNLGRHMTLHPSFRVCALFDERVDGWDGAMQSAYSDAMMDQGITFVSAYNPPSVLAAAFPGVGKAHRRLIERVSQLAVFGGMIHDDGGGQVRRWISREPLILYRMTARDRARFFLGMQTLGKMAFAAGAKEVLLPIFGADTFKSEAELDFLTSNPPSAKRIESLSFHPLGSAKMSVSEDGGVVKPSGETWQVDNLFVVDGSVLPTSIGVNSQLAIMTMALKISRGLLRDWSRYARRAA